MWNVKFWVIFCSFIPCWWVCDYWLFVGSVKQYRHVHHRHAALSSPLISRLSRRDLTWPRWQKQSYFHLCPTLPLITCRHGNTAASTAACLCCDITRTHRITLLGGCTGQIPVLTTWGRLIDPLWGSSRQLPLEALYLRTVHWLAVGVPVSGRLGMRHCSIVMDCQWQTTNVWMCRWMKCRWIFVLHNS